MALSGVALHSPQTLQEAFRLLDELEDVRILAGGTDLLVDVKQGLLKVRHLVSLRRIEGLRTITAGEGRVCLGATATPRDISQHPLVKTHFPALADACRSMASFQVRSLATIGGNISSAVPSADLPPPLIAMEASVSLECSGGVREIPLADFFTGPRDTVCGRGEVLTAVYVPLPLPSSGTAYQRMTLREANALAVASVASTLTLSKGSICRAKIVLGAVAPMPIVAARASGFLLGKEPSENLFRDAARIAQDESQPISDIRGSIWFRKELVRVLTCRALEDSLIRAQTDNQGGR